MDARIVSVAALADGGILAMTYKNHKTFVHVMRTRDKSNLSKCDNVNDTSRNNWKDDDTDGASREREDSTILDR